MKTLVILHGWKSSKERWQKVKEEIEKSGIRIFQDLNRRLNLKNHGI